MRDIYADDDVVLAALRFARSDEFRCVARWAQSGRIKPPARVLDLGAGRGIASLAWSVYGYAVTALEPDASDLVGSGAIRELTRRTGVPMEVLESNGESIPLDSQSVDLVYTRQVLHHASNLRAMCAEIARVLRPGGLCVATREHVVSDQTELEKFWQNHPVHQLAGGEMAYKESEYCMALTLAGLTKVKVYGPWDTIVNYFPVEPGRVTENILASAAQRFGPVIGPAIGDMRPYRWLWIRNSSRLDRTPGRMFSFVASRPSTRLGRSFTQWKHG